MTYQTDRADSDSVNLGSNPSSPANKSADLHDNPARTSRTSENRQRTTDAQEPAQCADREELTQNVAAVWRAGLDHNDWLFDGAPIKGRVMLARFANLDWSKAWIDLGPSIAGNMGPYWHVPLKETVIDGELYDCGDTVHRLYPKVLQGKWGVLILHACLQSQARGKS